MTLNKKVYIAGPLTNCKGFLANRNLCDIIVNVCEQHSFIPYAPHIEKRKRDVARQSANPTMIFKWDYECLKQADLVIAYVGIPSMGVGMELGLAAEWSTTVITFCEEGVEVSPMVLGHPSLICHIQYENEAELVKKLNDTLAEV
jgi:2'-deoxynucleoside 5'-phosphate N-hydrolase